MPRSATATGLATLGMLGAGLAFSSPPALAAPPETPVSKPATSIAGTTATLNGELNPGTATEPLKYQFAFKVGATECAGERLAPETPPEAEGNHKAVSTPVSGLEGSTQYSFCVTASNSLQESASGAPLSFTTLAEKPLVVAQSTSGMTPFAAVLQAEVNPENQLTTSCVFEWGTTNKYGEPPAACEPAAVEGSAVAPVTASLVKLSSGTTYHFRAVVKNATGETNAPDAEFTTPTAQAPTILPFNVVSLTADAATLQDAVNPNFQKVSCQFAYGTSPVLAESVAVPCQPEELGEGGRFTFPTAAVTGLVAHTTYYYRVTATNKTGATIGPTQHFTTLGTPALTAAEASGLTRTAALLTGVVNPSGAPTTFHFTYIDQAGYEAALAQSAANPYAKGAITPDGFVASSCNNGEAPGVDCYAGQPVGPFQIGELRPGVTYHYATVATNSVGTTTGPDKVFTTPPPTPPTATTGEAVEVSANSATITGVVDTRELPTSLQFEVGTVPEAGSLVPAIVGSSAGSGGAVSISATFSSSLQQDTTYYYRTVATSSDGTSYGAERSFTTGSFPGLPGVSPAQFVGWPAFVGETAARAAREALEATNTGPMSKPLTKAQKLAKALKACKKNSKHKREVCEARARKQYAAKHKPGSKRR
jgi:hypothetical protein